MSFEGSILDLFVLDKGINSEVVWLDNSIHNS